MESGPTRLQATNPPEIEHLKALWDKEKKEGDPELKLHFLFGYHQYKSDALRIKEEFEKCDIFIPEKPGFHPAEEKKFQELSAGLISPEQLQAEYPIHRVFYDFSKAQREMIYRSKKVIIFVDVPEDHITNKIFMGEIQNLFLEVTKANNLSGKIELYKKAVMRFVEINRQREDYILARIPQRIRKLLDGNSKLKKKSTLNILIFLGTAHTPIFIKTREATHNTTRSLAVGPNESTIVFPYRDEIARRVIFGQPINSISEDLIAKGILETDLHMFLPTNDKDTNSIKRIGDSRKLVDLFSTNDLQKIYELVERGKGFRESVLEIYNSKEVPKAT